MLLDYFSSFVTEDIPETTNPNGIIESDVQLQLPVDKFGNTIGHIAAIQSEKDVIKQLRDIGCILKSKNVNNQTILTLLMNNRSLQDIEVIELQQLILESNYSPADQFFINDEITIEAAKKIFKEYKGINDKAESSGGMNALMIAVEEGALDLVEWLLNNGASTKLIDDFGNSILHLVSLSGSGNVKQDIGDDSVIDHDDDEDRDIDFDNLVRVKSSEAFLKGNSHYDGYIHDETLTTTEINALKVLEALVKKGAIMTHVNNMGDNLYVYYAESCPHPASYIWALRILMFYQLNRFNQEEGNNNNEPAEATISQNPQNPSLPLNIPGSLGFSGWRNDGNDNLSDDDEMDPACILIERFGDGPWIDWLISRGFIKGRDEKILHYAKKYNLEKDYHAEQKRIEEIQKLMYMNQNREKYDQVDKATELESYKEEPLLK